VVLDATETLAIFYQPRSRDLVAVDITSEGNGRVVQRLQGLSSSPLISFDRESGLLATANPTQLWRVDAAAPVPLSLVFPGALSPESQSNRPARAFFNIKRRWVLSVGGYFQFDDARIEVTDLDSLLSVQGDLGTGLNSPEAEDVSPVALCNQGEIAVAYDEDQSKYYFFDVSQDHIFDLFKEEPTSLRLQGAQEIALFHPSGQVAFTLDNINLPTALYLTDLRTGDLIAAREHSGPFYGQDDFALYWWNQPVDPVVLSPDGETLFLLGRHYVPRGSDASYPFTSYRAIARYPIDLASPEVLPEEPSITVMDRVFGTEPRATSVFTEDVMCSLWSPWPPGEGAIERINWHTGERVGAFSVSTLTYEGRRQAVSGDGRFLIITTASPPAIHMIDIPPPASGHGLMIW
jgi:hypothetical protein